MKYLAFCFVWLGFHPLGEIYTLYSISIVIPAPIVHRDIIAITDNTMDSSCLDSTLDLSAEDLRSSIQQLGHVTGQVGVEQILDVVFKDFCIGK